MRFQSKLIEIATLALLTDDFNWLFATAMDFNIKFVIIMLILGFSHGMSQWLLMLIELLCTHSLQWISRTWVKCDDITCRLFACCRHVNSIQVQKFSNQYGKSYTNGSKGNPQFVTRNIINRKLLMVKNQKPNNFGFVTSKVIPPLHCVWQRQFVYFYLKSDCAFSYKLSYRESFHKFSPSSSYCQRL